MRDAMEWLESLSLCAPGTVLRRFDESCLIPCSTRILHEHKHEHEHDALVRELVDERVEHQVVCVRETT